MKENLAILRLEVTPVKIGAGGMLAAQGITSWARETEQKEQGPQLGELFPIRDLRGWLGAQQAPAFPIVFSMDTDLAGVGWGPLVSTGWGASYQEQGGGARPLTCLSSSQLGAGFSDEELEEHHQNLQVSRAASAALSQPGALSPHCVGFRVWTEQWAVQLALEPGSSPRDAGQGVSSP